MITLPSGRKIGEGEKPFIIAEVGSNWHTYEDCLNSITQAHKAGADAVKFQLYDRHALYGFSGEIQGRLPQEWIPKLKTHADAVGIELMCTAFSPYLYEVVNPYVNLHKVASAEMTHIRILEKLTSYGKPVLLSTGAKGFSDIKLSLDQLGGLGLPLYCVAEYPAQEIYLENLCKFREWFGTDVGFSDHTTDICVIPRVACSKPYSACVIEKHFKLSHISGTPDANHSLNETQFKKMVQSIRGELKNHEGPQPSEIDMTEKHNRRLIAIHDIYAGDSFQEGVNFGIYRSLSFDVLGLHPFAVNQVNGKKSTKKLEAGDPIGPGCFA